MTILVIPNRSCSSKNMLTPHGATAYGALWWQSTGLFSPYTRHFKFALVFLSSVINKIEPLSRCLLLSVFRGSFEGPGFWLSIEHRLWRRLCRSRVPGRLCHEGSVRRHAWVCSARAHGASSSLNNIKAQAHTFPFSASEMRKCASFVWSPGVRKRNFHFK